MSVVTVILLFVLVALILVRINLHQKRDELYKLISSIGKTIMVRHKKIKKLLKYVEENDLTNEIKSMNDDIIEKINNNQLSPSKMVKKEVLLEAKVKELLKTIENNGNASEEFKKAIEAYKATQKTLEKSKKKYNKMIEDFMEACNIKPAHWLTSIEKIDTDFEEIEQDKENL